MNKEEIESKLQKCVEYLRENEIDIKFYQNDKLIYEYNHHYSTKIYTPLYGELQEHIKVADTFKYLRYLLDEIEDSINHED